MTQIFNYSYHHLHKSVLEFPHGWSNRYHRDLCFYDATFLISQNVHFLWRDLRRKSSSLLQIITHRSVYHTLDKEKNLNPCEFQTHHQKPLKLSLNTSLHGKSGLKKIQFTASLQKSDRKKMWKYTPHRPSENSSRKIYFSLIDNTTTSAQHETKSLCTGNVREKLRSKQKSVRRKICHLWPNRRWTLKKYFPSQFYSFSVNSI